MLAARAVRHFAFLGNRKRPTSEVPVRSQAAPRTRPCMINAWYPAFRLSERPAPRHWWKWRRHLMALIRNSESGTFRLDDDRQFLRRVNQDFSRAI